MFEMQGIRKLRVAQFKELIQKHGLRAIVISGTENFQFFTNIQLSSHYWERPFALVIPADGEPFALVNMVSENGVMMQVERQSSWISNLSFYSELPRMQDRTYTLGQFTRMLQEKLEAAGLDAGQIGYDSKTPHLAELATLLPRISLSSVSSELKRLRWVKHPEEIAILQAAATLGDWAINKLRDNLKPGRGLQELSAHVTALVMLPAEMETGFDPRTKAMSTNLPFDGMRMIYAGFDTILDQGSRGKPAYVDATLIPVPTANKDVFRDWAKKMAAVFTEHGATRVVDGWGDDVPDGKVTDFKRAVKAEGDETVMYGWVEWASKETRDQAWNKMMADPRMQPGHEKPPFDGQRMVYGGFAPILDA